ncbi:histidine phosphatase family protein [Fredinandcohnia quinoae]|uniref:Histidine phosphatase family protein n=1 Tax=Fredinandcohnia quinoae TaxID=2918902 RepID=A0AAW5E1Z6_9BACI|nr:phosphoglycerate mutase family protein [Fredinandcohnia sp. SECRCQ15]MCH1626368.1 histidine phosphatase family protein [Fredinandcohnia sp. SECRCQ15]
MQLILIRHLPTEWNKKGILQGKQDIAIMDLTEEYNKEIEKNNKIIAKHGPISTVVTSFLNRTQQTAMAHGYYTYQVDPLLNELDFGEFEGRDKSQLIEVHGDKWLYDPKQLILGERLSDFEIRVITFIEKYRNYKNVLIFGHGSWIRACVSYRHYGSIDNMNKIEIKNNELVVLDFSEKLI